MRSKCTVALTTKWQRYSSSARLHLCQMIWPAAASENATAMKLQDK